MSDKMKCCSSTNESSCSEGSSNEILINKLNAALKTVIDENKLLKNYKKIISFQKKSIFNKNEIPTISVKDYLFRIQNFANMEENTLITSLIYLDKITQMNGIVLSPFNIHRFLFVAILFSIKYNEDVVYTNDYYAKVAGISEKELNNLEYKFFELIRFKLYVSKEEFETYKKYLMNIKCEDD